MRTWIQLTAEKAHTLYRVPTKIAAADNNAFFGLVHHSLDLDGPWPLVAFLQDDAYSGVIAFHIFSVLPEALEFEGFNPLTEKGGYLSLKRQEVAGLIDLLRLYAQRLPSMRKIEQKMFGKIEDSELADFHLHPEWSPNTKRDHYYQVYDPLVELRKNSTATILIFSTGHTGPSEAPSNLFFQIGRFPKQALQDASFTPLDHSLARINLDRSGMQELASLLEACLDHLAD